MKNIKQGIIGNVKINIASSVSKADSPLGVTSVD